MVNNYNNDFVKKGNSKSFGKFIIIGVLVVFCIFAFFLHKGYQKKSRIEEENRDKVAPVITLVGPQEMKIAYGEEFKDQGATAVDDVDGDITSKIEKEGKIDSTIEGAQTIIYKVADSSGNLAEVKRTVTVRAKESKGVVYLTFDDGPSETSTPKILDILKEKNVKATFFILNFNESTEKYLKREVEEGHAIGIHGYSHDYSKIYTSLEACYDNIIKLQDKIYNSVGIKVMILRFPGGSSNTVSKKYCPGVMSAISKKVLSEGFKYYDWNVLSGDSGNVKTSEAVYENVTKGIKPGRDNIVLMHDFSNNQKTIDALPRIIDYIKEKGYEFDVITTETKMVTQNINN